MTTPYHEPHRLRPEQRLYTVENARPRTKGSV